MALNQYYLLFYFFSVILIYVVCFLLYLQLHFTGLFSFRSITGFSESLILDFSVPVRLQTAPTGPGCPKLDEKTEN